MSMSIRELTTINRHAIALEENTKAINSRAGKEFMKERLALEKAHGGAKKFAYADKVRADAEAVYTARVKDGARVAAKVVLDAEAEISQIKADLTERARVLDMERSNLDQRRDALDEQDRAGIRKREAVKKREDAADARGMEQDTRDSDLRTREAKADEGDAKRVEYERWQAGRPSA